MTNDAIYTNIHSASPLSVAEASMHVLDILQHKPADIQICAATVLFLTLCRRYDIYPTTAMNAVDNLMQQARRYDAATFKGIEDYFKNEL